MRILFILFLSLIPLVSRAADSAADIVAEALLSSAASITNDLTGVGIKLLFAFTLLQFIINMYGAIKAGEVEATMGKVATGIVWTCFCLYTMFNGGDFLQKTSDSMLGMASKWVGGETIGFSTGDVISAGLQSYGNIVSAVAASVTGSPLKLITAVLMPELSLLTALLLGITVLVLLASCAIIAIKIFMVKLELAIVIAISPLSFSFLGLNALRDQGTAPFKYLIAVLYRIVILAAIVSSMTKVSNAMVAVLQTTSSSGGDIFTPIFGALFGYILIAYFAFKSDSIASTIASGSSNLSSGDVATAAAAGAAAGAALVTGGASLAGAGAAGASKAGQTMGDFMKSMARGGGSVTNASGGTGRGGPIGEAPKQSQPAGSPGGAMPNLASKPSAATGGASGNAVAGAGNEAAATASTPAGSNEPGEGAIAGMPTNMSPGDSAAAAAESTARTDGASPGAATVAGRAAGNAADRGATPAQAALAGAVAQAAITAGASPDAAYAAGNAAAAGRSAQDISAAVTGAGGTSAQGAAAAAAAAPISRGAGASARPMGSGATAGIGGSGNAPHAALEQKVDRLADSLGGARTPTLGNRLSELNEHAATIDNVGVSVSVNAHAD